MSHPTGFQPNVGGALSGAASGAALGATLGSVVPGVGTVIGGAVGGVAGFIGGLFGKSKEQKMQERKHKLLERLRELKMERLTRTFKRGRGLIARERVDAARQAAALGVEDPSRFAATGIERAQIATLGEAERVEQEFGAREAHVEGGFADRPIAPSFIEQAGAFATSAAGLIGDIKGLGKTGDVGAELPTGAVEAPGLGSQAGLLGARQAVPTFSNVPELPFQAPAALPRRVGLRRQATLLSGRRTRNAPRLSR